jgi:iron complex outermembrane receptor protein
MRCVALLVCSLAVVPRPALGRAAARLSDPQEVPVPPIDVEGTRGTGDVDPSVATPFVTVIDTHEAPEQVRTLAEALVEAAGVQVRSLGGLGAYSAVSIRGSSSAQVAVFLDGIPLNRGAFGGVDLSLLPLDGIERIEVWRGQAPPELGGQAIGGAINLVTRRAAGASQSMASVSYGSFLTRKLDLFHARRGRKWDWSAFVSYLGSEGDFPFRNDNGTTQNSGDDFEDRRRNNDFDQIDAHAQATRYGPGGDELRLGAHAQWKAQGVPGTAHADVVAARLDTERLATDARWTHAGAGPRALETRLSAFAVLERRHFTDPDPAELGGLYDLVDWSVAGGAAVRVSLGLGRHQAPSLSAEAGGERFSSTNALVPSASSHALRVAGGLVLGDAIAFGEDALLLEPALRLDLYRTTGPSASPALAMPPGPDLDRADVTPSPRIGARWRTPLPGLAVKANFGRYFRLPTFYDLYANLGYFVGRPDLRPETSWNWDAGVALERAALGPLSRIFAEAAWFETRTSDLIVYTPGFRFTSPVNVMGATGRGLEATVALAAAGATLTGSYTWLDLRDDATFRRIAGRPAHEGYARLEVERRLVGLGGAALGGWYEARANAGMFADAANEIAIPLRLYHALGVRARLTPRWTTTVEVKNLTDQREELLVRPNSACPPAGCPQAIADFGGYPLPGRAWFATLTWKE